MTKSHKDFRASLNPGQLAASDARAAELIAEEMTLRDLRRAHKLTQVRMAELLGVEQDKISRLERRSDLLLSTLKSYVQAMGGSLTLVAEFPDRPPVALATYGDLADGEPSPLRARRSRKGAPVPGSPG